MLFNLKGKTQYVKLCFGFWGFVFFRFMNYRIICNKDKLSNIVIL